MRWNSIPSPSLLNFLSGVFAGTGINIVTTAAVGGSTASAFRLVSAATPWVALAAICAFGAAIAEKAQRESDLLITSALTPEERQEIVGTAARRIRRKVLYLLALAITVFSAAMFLTLRLASTDSRTTKDGNSDQPNPRPAASTSAPFGSSTGQPNTSHESSSPNAD